MEEKLQFVPSLKDAFAIGVKNLVPIVLSVLLWLVTVWIPYVNVGTTIALATLPVKLSKGEMISPMFIFDSEYRHCMGECSTPSQIRWAYLLCFCAFLSAFA